MSIKVDTFLSGLLQWSQIYREPLNNGHFRTNQRVLCGGAVFFLDASKYMGEEDRSLEVLCHVTPP